ncbi:MAG: phytanoyl-CoA dioxygenase family protein [Gemmatimonadales bacterium]|nr:phytanoyl-CoA dioxygenase family protein [Gemmatimonadales bacterium]
MTALDLPNAVTSYAEQLDRDGIVVVPRFVQGAMLAGMQRAFARALERPRWNNFDGYSKTELYRHMVEDVLMLDQGFVDFALHPVIVQTVREYVGDNVQLREAKGWLSKPTTRDFHGWHGDAWYDQTQVTDRIPREVKAALYLTDVRSGAFEYLKGTHRKEAPRPVRNSDIGTKWHGEMAQALGPAGTLILFDTSGIHRQGVPMLERRHAIFYNYHQPDVPLQREDVVAYRYHPLLLNAAFLGGLSEDDMRLLGFGDQTHYQPDFRRPPKHEGFQAAIRTAYDVKLTLADLPRRVKDVLRPILKR